MEILSEEFLKLFPMLVTRSASLMSTTVEPCVVVRIGIHGVVAVNIRIDDGG